MQTIENSYKYVRNNVSMNEPIETIKDYVKKIFNVFFFSFNYQAGPTGAGERYFITDVQCYMEFMLYYS